ncbi:MAG: hypothetical protein ACYTHM_01480 [Planctomycetota bacterium]|jgi:hypothetical protein
MSRIDLFHHVYSSQQGYRTLKASPQIPSSTVEVLEEISAKLYPKARSTARFSFFPPDEIFLCCSMNVLSGVDHVGRTRSLVHNILLRRETLQETPGFNHLQIPHNLFLRPGEDLQRAVKTLIPEFIFDESNFPPPPSRFDKESLPRKSVLHLLRVMLGERPTVIRGEKDLAYDRIVKVSGLLPAVIRETLALLNGIFLPEFADIGHPTIYLVPKDFDLAGTVRSGYIALDSAGMQGFNLPRPHPWDRFVVGHLTAGDTRKDLETLLNVINRFRPLSRYTPQAFQDLIKAFEEARSCFDPDGHLNIQRAPSEALRSTGSFFQAGHPDIVFDIFLGCLQLLGARELSEEVQNFGRMIAEGAETLIPLFLEASEVSVEDMFDFDV